MADDWDGRGDWSNFEQDMWEGISPDNEFLNDRMLQAVFDTAFFDFTINSDVRIAAREYLAEHVAEYYGIDLHDVFDWEAWREAYGIQS